MEIPESLDHLRASQGGRAWLSSLQEVVAECAERWSLVLGEPYGDSYVSLTVPAVRAHEPVVLKVQFPHTESEHEAAALRAWDGGGAVRLLEHDPEHHALLLERCEPGDHLSRHPRGALDVFVDLIPRLSIPAGPPFRALDDEAEEWIESLRARRSDGLVEAKLIEAAIDALDSVRAEPVETVLLHQDLHGDNILASTREPWLAIDPKPLAGDPTFAVAPVVRSYEFGHSRAAVLYRLDALTERLGLDRERSRWWTLGQTMAWAFEGDEVLPRHVETASWLIDAG